MLINEQTQAEWIRFHKENPYPWDVFLNRRSMHYLIGLLDHQNKPFGQYGLFSRDSDGLDLTHLLAKTYFQAREGQLYNSWETLSGSKKREISNPKFSFKVLADRYLFPFIHSQKVHPNAHGGEFIWHTQRSLMNHLPMNSSFSFDISSAFPSTKPEYVFSFFHDVLKALSQKEKRDLAGLLTYLTTVKSQDKTGIPQGASFSQMLFNRVFYPLDIKLNEYAKSRGLNYSRWIDDLIFSSPEYTSLDDFIGATQIVKPWFPLSLKKMIYQPQDPIYLLGIEIVKNRMHPMRRTERAKIKLKSLETGV